MYITVYENEQCRLGKKHTINRQQQNLQQQQQQRNEKRKKTTKFAHHRKLNSSHHLSILMCETRLKLYIKNE